MTLTPCQNYLKWDKWNMNVPNITEKTTTVQFDAQWKKQFGDQKKISVALPGGMHPMISAAKCNNIGLIHHFFEKDKTVLNLGNMRGWTPLFCAVYQRKRQAAETLIDLGADVNITSIQTFSVHMMRKIPQGATCLWIAAVTNNLAMVKLLLKFGAIPAPELDTVGHAVIEKANNELEQERTQLILTLDETFVVPRVLLQEIAEYLLPVYSPPPAQTSTGSMSQGQSIKKRKHTELSVSSIR